MPYIVTVRRVDTDVVLATVTCPDLRAALRAKSRAFRSYHYSDLGGQVVVPASMDFDDWDDVDRLRHGNPGPYLPVHVTVGRVPAVCSTAVPTDRGAASTSVAVAVRALL